MNTFSLATATRVFTYAYEVTPACGGTALIFFGAACVHHTNGKTGAPVDDVVPELGVRLAVRRVTEASHCIGALVDQPNEEIEALIVAQTDFRKTSYFADAPHGQEVFDAFFEDQFWDDVAAAADAATDDDFQVYDDEEWLMEYAAEHDDYWAGDSRYW